MHHKGHEGSIFKVDSWLIHTCVPSSMPVCYGWMLGDWCKPNIGLGCFGGLLWGPAWSVSEKNAWAVARVFYDWIPCIHSCSHNSSLFLMRRKWEYFPLPDLCCSLNSGAKTTLHKRGCFDVSQKTHMMCRSDLWIIR